MSLRIYEEEIDTGIKTPRYYDTFRLHFNWHTPAVTLVFDTQASEDNYIKFKAGDKVGKSDGSWLEHKV
jgi:hypothetical protein